MTSCDSIGTPMATKHLDADLSGTPIDQTKYHSKVEALMYLTASRPDIMHATCYCARYQAQPSEKHLTAVKRIFRYLKDTIHMGLWYPKDTGFELTAFSDSDHAGCLDSHKSTSGGLKGLARWDLRKGHMGGWGRDVGGDWVWLHCLIILRKLPVDPAFAADFQSRVDIVCAIRINFGYCERAGPAGLEFSKKDLKARIEEQDLITDIEDAILDL
nr:hypothetical protein [Tanacetum cinerariifolium]